MQSNEKKSFFRQLQKFQPDYSASIFTEYESQRTGMRVVTVDQKGPIVAGYFVLATEIHDDSGSPHTLEHLCFMGSRNYQYKGFLDKLASRAYSETNAWTAIDHTAYTMESAGWEGFAMVLPVYLEHVIIPTLTDEGYYTEVYHIDGSGHDAGVVYSEVQGVQNTASELMDLETRRQLYPQGVGFRQDTKGLMEQLRTLTPDRIRAFHREMYQPKNLCLVITGEVDHDNLLQILDEFESTIIDIIPPPDAPFKRPWIDSNQTPPLEKSVIKTVQFPDEDESFGEIEIRFLGPDCTDPILTGALNVALLYLAGSSAGVLENTLVEKEQVASAVYYATEDRPKTEIQFTLSSVATESLAEVERRFFEVLQNAMDTKLDMNYMRECIHRHERSWKFATETSATAFAEYALSDFVYGKRDGSTLRQVATLSEFGILEKWDDQQWRSFIRHWISDAPHVSVLGVPSSKMVSQLSAEEELRVSQRREKLGEDGLKSLSEKLEKARDFNEREIPRESLLKLEAPGTDAIHFIETTTARAGYALRRGHPEHDVQHRIDSDGADLPLYIQFENVPSNFVQFSLMVSTLAVPQDLLPLLSIYLEAFFNLPVAREGEVLPFERVIVELERDTVGYYMQSSPGDPEMLSIAFQVEVEKYEAAIAWLKDLSLNSVFDVERLKSITKRLLSEVPDKMRSGSRMLAAVEQMIQYSPESISRARTPLVKVQYLKRVKQLLASAPEEVVSRMETIRKSLFQLDNFRILVVADLEKLSHPVSPWKRFIDGLGSPADSLKPVVKPIERLSDAGKAPGKLAYVVPMPAIDSSFANMSAKGPDSYDHRQLPALMVAIAYMNATEGPLWVATRGTGLAYGVNFSYDIERGLVHYQIYRSPNAHKAFLAGKKAVEDHLTGAAQFDPLLALESAISSIVSNFAFEQGTYSASAHDSFIRQVIRELPSDYKKVLLKNVRAVDVDGMKAALRDIILPIFTPGSSDIIVTCATTLQETIQTGFQSSGFNPEVQSLKYFQDGYGLKADEEDDESLDDGDSAEEISGSEEDEDED